MRRIGEAIAVSGPNNKETFLVMFVKNCSVIRIGVTREVEVGKA